MTELSFPPKGSPFSAQTTHFYQFWASRWSSFNSNRTRAKVKSEAQVSITLPFPRAVGTYNNVNYNETGAQIGGGLYERAVADVAANGGGLRSGIFDLIGYAVDVIGAPLAKAGSRLTGGDTINTDDTEVNFLPGAKRKHSFEFLLTARTEAEAIEATKIAKTFQNYTFPTADNISRYTMQHPFLWCFSSFDPRGKSQWDNEPLVSVLQSAIVSKIPFNNLPYSVAGSYEPVGTVINLAFLELEPALRQGDKLISRSERLYGGAV